MQPTDKDFGKFALGDKFEIESEGSKYVVNMFFNTESKFEAKDILNELIKNKINEIYGQCRELDV